MTFFCSGSTRLRDRLRGVLGLSTMLFTCAASAAYGATGTTTTFTITANGVPLTTVDTHSTVKLTAEVRAGSAKVTTGQVAFCDASFKHSCLDFRQVGTVQLTKDGIASLRFIPGPGEHRYKAVFLGTTEEASSTSAVSTLTVESGPAPHRTKTSLSASGVDGAYTLTASITAPASALPLVPGGVVYFQDKSDGNAVLGKVVLPSGPSAIHYLETSQPFVNSTKAGFPNQAAAIGDFNGDGKPDFVLCKEDACPVVALGNGDGTFQDAPAMPPLATPFTAAQVGDFNQDGKLDLIVLYGTPQTFDQQNYFYPGAGDGTFLSPVKMTIKSSAGELGGARAVADFNKDGIPDLLVLYKFQIGVALGRGDGSFEVGWTTPKGTHTLYSEVAGDFDGDGIQDFAAVVGISTFIGHPALFFGAADGSFHEVDLGLFSSQLGAADIDGDGRTEVTSVASQDSDARNYAPGFSIVETHADRSFSFRRAVGANPLYYDSENVVIDDFNRDGIADAALVGEPYFGYDDAIVPVILLGNADGSFTQAPRNALPATHGLTHFSTFAAADFDGDGLPDLAATGAQAGTNYPAYGVLLTRDGQAGVASIRPPAGAGTHSVVARYTGDENFFTSVSKPLMLSAPEADTPVATLSSNALQFGEEPVSEPSNAQTVVLTNTGTGPLTISDISVSLDGGGFDTSSFATSNNCPASLAVGAACKIRVRFVPGSTGSKQKVLNITDNAPNSPQVISLLGVGVKR